MARPGDILALIFLLFGSLLGVLLGLMLILKPQFLERLERFANRWVSTRHLILWADRSLSIEHWVYRHHRAAGAVIVLGASYIFIYFGILLDKATMLQRLSSHFPHRLPDGLLDALVPGSMVGGAAAHIHHRVVSMVASRPAARHAQRVGWLMLLASIYLFFVLSRLLA